LGALSLEFIPPDNVKWLIRLLRLSEQSNLAMLGYTMISAARFNFSLVSNAIIPALFVEEMDEKFIAPKMVPKIE
jgi:hypothetical protein